jgi:hypothetical protein
MSASNSASAAPETTPLATAAPAAGIDPVVVDLGKKSRKQIKNLKKGKGKLVRHVAAVLEEVKANGGAELAGKELVPIVIVYRRKPKRRGSSWLPMLP